MSYVPFKAFSCGTLLALCGSKICIGLYGFISPIDSQHTFNVPNMTNSVRYSSRNIMNLGDEISSTDNIYKMMVFEAKQYHESDRNLLTEVMKYHKYSDEIIANIVKCLSSGEIYYHDYIFGFEFIKQNMKLNIFREMPQEIYDLVSLL